MPIDASNNFSLFRTRVTILDDSGNDITIGTTFWDFHSAIDVYVTGISHGDDML